MTHLNKNNNSKSKPRAKTKSLSVVRNEPSKADTGLHIDARLLIKRINTLVAHVSNLDGAEEAEKNSRETSAHIKNIKEIIALNENIERVQSQTNQGYTPQEEAALAEELAVLIIKNGGFS